MTRFFQLILWFIVFFLFTFPSFLKVMSKYIDLNREKQVNKYKEIIFLSQIKGFSFVARVLRCNAFFDKFIRAVTCNGKWYLPWLACE